MMTIVDVMYVCRSTLNLNEVVMLTWLFVICPGIHPERVSRVSGDAFNESESLARSPIKSASCIIT
jgi:hypothetical protein